jgi:hypothetical protein
MKWDPPADKSGGREISLCAGRRFSDRIGICDRRSERGRKSRPAPFGPAMASGMQKPQMTAGGVSRHEVTQNRTPKLGR